MSKPIQCPDFWIHQLDLLKPKPTNNVHQLNDKLHRLVIMQVNYPPTPLRVDQWASTV